jgi:O-succinylbenzoic acid--CoA ligase
MDRNGFSLIDPNKTHVLLNPVLPRELQDAIHAKVDHLHTEQPMLWILSSGTTSTKANSYKLIGLSRNSFLASAQSVNLHLNVTTADRWLNVLPLFHVGGLGILYRAFASGTDCINQWNPNFKWNPQSYVRDCHQHHITLSSLVPTQIHDLVSTGLSAPPSLRAIVVGGAKLDWALYLKARALGWPLLPSYGMTEASSQVATASMESLANITPSEMPPLHVLPHLNDDGRLSIAGTSLLEGYYSIVEGDFEPWMDPKDASGWFTTQDCAELRGSQLKILGRTDEVIKIRGENVNLSGLREQLANVLQKNQWNIECTIAAIPHPRLGWQLALVSPAPEKELRLLGQELNKTLLGFERIEVFYPLTPLPRTELGKIQQQRLVESLLKKQAQSF